MRSIFANCKRWRRTEPLVVSIVSAALFASVWVLPVTLKAQDLMIVTEDAAPFNFQDAGKITGSSTEIVEEILRRLDVEARIELVPWARGYKRALSEPNVVLFSVARSNDREDLFYWVGPIAAVQNAFYAVRGAHVAIEDIDDARRVGRIGTRKADMRESYLQALGFDNLDSTNSNLSNLRKLLEGRIDVWATSNIEVQSVVAQQGLDPSALKHVYTFQTLLLYIAISKGTSPAIVSDWQAALDAMKADGTFMAISRKWLSENSLPQSVSRPSAQWVGNVPIAVYTENSPPGNYVEEGRLQGPAVRVVDEILRRLGSSVTIEVVPWARGYHLARTEPNVALFSTSRLPQREKLFK